MHLTIKADSVVIFRSTHTRASLCQPSIEWAIERFDPLARAWEAVHAKRHGRGPNGFASIDGLPIAIAFTAH